MDDQDLLSGDSKMRAQIYCEECETPFVVLTHKISSGIVCPYCTTTVEEE